MDPSPFKASSPCIMMSLRMQEHLDYATEDTHAAHLSQSKHALRPRTLTALPHT